MSVWSATQMHLAFCDIDTDEIRHKAEFLWTDIGTVFFLRCREPNNLFTQLSSRRICGTNVQDAQQLSHPYSIYPAVFLTELHKNGQLLLQRMTCSISTLVLTA